MTEDAHPVGAVPQAPMDVAPELAMDHSACEPRADVEGATDE